MKNKKLQALVEEAISSNVVSEEEKLDSRLKNKLTKGAKEIAKDYLEELSDLLETIPEPIMEMIADNGGDDGGFVGIDSKEYQFAIKVFNKEFVAKAKKLL